jgi:tetratricopeptide (TPR) repeat protein
MPRFSVDDIPHASQTDHRVPRRPGAVAQPAPPAQLELFDSAEQRLDPVDLQRALGIRKMQLQHGFDAALPVELDRTFRKALEKYPDDIELLDRLGLLAMAQHRFGEAENFWRSVLNVRPEHEGALLRMSWVQNERGNLAEAVDCLRRYTAFNPWRSQVRLLLAQALWKSGKTDEAITEARQALALDPQNVALRQWLSGCLRQTGRTAAAQEQEQILKRMRGR